MLPFFSRFLGNETISLTYDVNEYVYSRKKSVKLRTDLINHEIRLFCLELDGLWLSLVREMFVFSRLVKLSV